jgi:Zn-finger nucleic acid-binding protein
MIVLELDQIEIDHCVACGGTWLDAGELELLLDGAENGNSLLTSVEENVAAHEKKRKCPICEKKMSKVAYNCGGKERVVVDKCKKNDGLWFDEGELTDLINMGDFPCEHRIYQLLSDVFGSYKGSEL